MMTTTAQKNWNDLQNEGCEGYVPEPTTEEVNNAIAAAAAAFAAEWTAEVTTARRLAWNARVKSGEFKSMKDANLAQQKQGWNLIELKDAIKINNL